MVSANVTEGCGLSFKHLDVFEWSDWVEQIEKDTTSIYLKSKSRTCLRNGQITEQTASCNGPSYEVLTHLKWMTNGKYWKGAKTTCANQGGILFGDLDGTQEQLEFLASKLGGDGQVYLGATAKTSKTDWRTLRGADIRNKIIWRQGAESAARKGDVLFLLGSPPKCKANAGVLVKRRFACDMR